MISGDLRVRRYASYAPSGGFDFETAKNRRNGSCTAVGSRIIFLVREGFLP